MTQPPLCSSHVVLSLVCWLSCLAWGKIEPATTSPFGSFFNFSTSWVSCTCLTVRKGPGSYTTPTLTRMNTDSSLSSRTPVRAYGFQLDLAHPDFTFIFSSWRLSCGLQASAWDTKMAALQQLLNQLPQSGKLNSCNKCVCTYLCVHTPTHLCIPWWFCFSDCVLIQVVTLQTKVLLWESHKLITT